MMKERDNEKFRAKLSILVLNEKGLLNRFMSPWKKIRLQSEMIIHLIHDVAELEERAEKLERR